MLTRLHHPLSARIGNSALYGELLRENTDALAAPQSGRIDMRWTAQSPALLPARHFGLMAAMFDPLKRSNRKPDQVCRTLVKPVGTYED